MSAAENPLPQEGAGPSGAIRLLFWLRMVAVVSQSLAILFVRYVLDGALPLPELAVTIGALALWNAVTYRTVYTRRRVGHHEVALHLAVDIAAFTSVIYFTGGPSNPFVSLYLVPISLAAISLPATYAWSLGALCALGYTLLWWHSVPLPVLNGRFGTDFNLHLMGMWVNFLVAAVLIVLSVGRMARLVRARDRELGEMRETALRDQQIVQLGALAAGTAHELNTPLSTLAILVEEIDETTTDAVQRQRLRVMAEEIKKINERLNRIARGVGAERSARARQVSLRAFVNELLEDWRRVHPEVELEVSLDAPAQDTRIVAEATIEQAIRNVLDNAARATLAQGATRVEVAVSTQATCLDFKVSDRGAGLDPAVRDEIGLRVVSTEDRGLGIGLLLSRAALQRFGGQLDIQNRSTGGVVARIHLPLAELLADAG